MRVQQTLASAGALSSTLTEMLDATGLGIVQLDPRGQIVATNDRARDLLRIGDGLFDREGFLLARVPRDNDDLQRLLNRALPRFGVVGAGGSTVVRRQDALLPPVMHVHPVDGRETDFPFSPVTALVPIVDPAGGADVDLAVLATALDLTGMEGLVATLLAQGMSVRQIAAATGRKESTIRSHIKQVFAKNGLSRQAELVRLVRALAGASGGRG